MLFRIVLDGVQNVRMSCFYGIKKKCIRIKKLKSNKIQVLKCYGDISIHVIQQGATLGELFTQDA